MSRNLKISISFNLSYEQKGQTIMTTKYITLDFGLILSYKINNSIILLKHFLQRFSLTSKTRLR
jgi:hypothetical protein